FDDTIRIHKAKTELLRHEYADSRFTRTHESGDDEVLIMSLFITANRSQSATPHCPLANHLNSLYAGFQYANASPRCYRLRASLITHQRSQPPASPHPQARHAATRKSHYVRKWSVPAHLSPDSPKPAPLTRLKSASS